MAYVAGVVVMGLVLAWAIAITRERTERLWHLAGAVMLGSLSFNLVRRGHDWAVALLAPAVAVAVPGLREVFGRRGRSPD